MLEAEGIILRTYRLREVDKICVVLTKRGGKVRGVLRRPRRNPLLNNACEEPFSEIRLQIFGREGQPLVPIKAVELIHSIFDTAAEPNVLTFLSYAAELLDSFIPEGEPCEVHYRLTKALIAEVQPHKIDDLKLYLEIWMLRLAGLLPSLQACTKCNGELGDDVWLAADGSPLCQSCGGAYGDYIGGAVRATWEQLLRTSPAELPPLDAEARRIIAPILQRLIRRALEREPNSLRSFGHYNLDF